jgi:peptidoglycan-associated lipoprotein
MREFSMMKKLMAASLLALFISSCATTDDELIQDDTSQVDAANQDGSVTGALDSTGVDTLIVDDTANADAIAIVDDSPSVREMLEQTDTPLANRTIYFEFDSAKLTDESLAILEVHGDFVASSSEVNVRLEGHSDERGSREYNISLADRRAQSVRRVLLFQGAAADQIETVSYGEEEPAVREHTEAAWAKNRRVEIVYQVN